jgi:cytochrome c-type biogenesis protein CcmH
MIRRAVALIALLYIVSAVPAHAVLPSEMLADPKLEARAREISKELRCLVCQNESIDESNADLAHDLRVLVRERLQAGDSDAQVIAYIVNRYGQFVLLRPPVEPETYLLWFSPALILALGALGAVLYLRRRRGAALEIAALSAAEEARLKRILEERDP